MVGRGDPVGRVDRHELVGLAAGVVRQHRLLGRRERGDRTGAAGALGELGVRAVEPDGALQHQLVGDLGLADRAVAVGVGDREQRVQRGGRPGRVAHPDHEPAPVPVPVRPPGRVLGHRAEHRPPGQRLLRPAQRGGPLARDGDDDRRGGQARAGPRQHRGRLRPARRQPGPDARLGRPGVRPPARRAVPRVAATVADSALTTVTAAQAPPTLGSVSDHSAAIRRSTAAWSGAAATVAVVCGPVQPVCPASRAGKNEPPTSTAPMISRIPPVPRTAGPSQPGRRLTTRRVSYQGTSSTESRRCRPDVTTLAAPSGPDARVPGGHGGPNREELSAYDRSRAVTWYIEHCSGTAAGEGQIVTR